MRHVDPNLSENSVTKSRGPFRENSWTRVVLLAAVLLLTSVAVLHHVKRGEFNINVDEGHHAVTGLYFSDLLTDLPWRHPIQYTYVYYARYPALGLIHWPPFFHFVEGIMFLLLGPSVVSARLTVLLFTLLGLLFWFKLVEELENTLTAVVATLLLAFLPGLILYEKAVMLEVPSLALCIVASYVWIRFLRSGQSRYVYWFALPASLALLTKQNSIYLIVFCFLSLVMVHKWHLLLNRAVYRAIGFSLLLIGPFYLLAFTLHWKDIHYSVSQRRVPGSPLLFYWSVLPSQLGLAVLVLSVVGIATSWWWGKRETVLLMLSWIASCYIMFTSLAGKEQRYILYWAPPFVYFAVAPWASAVLAPWVRRLGAAALMLVVALNGSRAWAYERPYVSGYSTAARWLTQKSSSEIVLYDGDLAANFIFYMRAFDPARRFVVMRKALYVVREEKARQGMEIVKSSQDLEALIDDFGIRYVCVENFPLEFKSQEILRAFLQTPRFKLVEVFPIQSNIPNLAGRTLLLYENQHVMPTKDPILRLNMLSLGYAIEVPLAELKK
jgi:hypothetical protein